MSSDLRLRPKFVDRKGRLPAKLAIAEITEWKGPLWDSFQIKITPTMVVFRDGTPVGRLDRPRFIGLRDSDLDQLADLLEKLVFSTPPLRTLRSRSVGFRMHALAREQSDKSRCVSHYTYRNRISKD